MHSVCGGVGWVGGGGEGGEGIGKMLKDSLHPEQFAYQWQALEMR